MSSRKLAFLQGLNVVAFVATVGVNALAGSTTLLNGKTSGEISDLYPTLITPAGYTFSIWGLIYTLLLVFIIYQALPRNKEQSFLTQTSFFFILIGILNGLWLFAWHYEILTFSVILMFALLTTLITIYLRLRIGRTDVSIKEKICVHLPFSVYLGWITLPFLPLRHIFLRTVVLNCFGRESALLKTYKERERSSSKNRVSAVLHP